MNEIDALLSELNQLQTTLVYPDQTPIKNNNDSDFLTTPNHNNDHQQQQLKMDQPCVPMSLKNPSFNNSSFNCNNNTNIQAMTNTNQHDECEAIDQQFDEVLKFLAESIDGNFFFISM